MAIIECPYCYSEDAYFNGVDYECPDCGETWPSDYDCDDDDDDDDDWG